MTKTKTSCVEKITWSDARDKVAKVDEKLALIIDEINPSSKYELIKVNYPFGSEILKDKLFRIPNEKGKMIPIKDYFEDGNIKAELSYSVLPLGIAVKNSIEVYREINNRIFSLACFNEGFNIGIWEFFGSTTPYNVSAGARSVYMIPKISSAMQHKKLKQHFDVTLPPPKHLSEHFGIFRQIINSSNFSKDWDCQVIYLTNRWAEAIENNKKWINLKTYILEKNWQHANYVRKKSVLDHAWDTFAYKLNERHLKFSSYIIDTLNHLILVATNVITASSSFTGDEKVGPFNELQKIYETCYELRDYVPTIMIPRYFSFNENIPVYYSLQEPTLLETSPRSKKIISTMDSIRELSELLNHFFAEDDINMMIYNESVVDIMKKVRFKFFHNKMYAYGKDIRPSKEMPIDDKNLLYRFENSKNSKFADSGSFVQGCVMISSQGN